jgi:ribosome-associated toxin RatA of RatAB toxin-antitoxin module
MHSVHKSVLVPYSAQQMFDLVERIEDYPKFLPWCGGTRILQRTADQTLARIDIDYRGVRAHFTTANRNQAPEKIVVELRDGPFRRLDGIWRFRMLSDAACKVEFELNYEFATTVLDKLIGPVFGRIADSFIEAFVKRAAAVHGPGA